MADSSKQKTARTDRAAPQRRNRRVDTAAETRNLLLERAAVLFSRQGFAHTSLEEIATSAGATKGALYHHFSSKVELYAACFERQAQRVAQRVASVEPSDDPWEDALAQCRAFLGCATLRHLHAVPIQEAITVLGWQRWRALDSAHTMGVLEASLRRLRDSGMLAEFDLRLLADSVFAILVNAMMLLSVASDKKATERELMRQLEAFLGGVVRR